MLSSDVALARLHALDTYAQVTFGRPVSSPYCVGCGVHTRADERTSTGLCARCVEKRTPSTDILSFDERFRP